MALGSSGIANVRNKINEIEARIRTVQSSNANFINLYKDENFQKFVLDTKKGDTINLQLQQLSKWVDSMCSTIRTMESRTENFLIRQEELNR